MIGGSVLWMSGAESGWAYPLAAALPAYYGLWNLRVALFDSQESLDKKLSGGNE